LQAKAKEVTTVQRIYTNELAAHVEERVRLLGWLHHRRELSRLSFAVLRDARGLAQIVVDDPATIEALPPASVLAGEGETVASATEGGANVFELDYFGRSAFLAQSPQFYKQIMVGVLERVYEVGPVFRAEPHDTPRHLAEYVSLDAEAGFIEDHRDVMRFARDAVAGMVDGVRSRSAEAVELLGVQLPDVPTEVPTLDFPVAQ